MFFSDILKFFYSYYPLGPKNCQCKLMVMDCCALGSGPLNDDEAQRYAQLFAVLGDPVRLTIVSRLAAEGCTPMSVTEITELTHLTQPTISHHLKKMADAGLITRTRDGRRVLHALEPVPFAELRTILNIG